MRRNKLLIPAFAVASIIPAVSMSVSCGDKKSDAEKIMDAIIAPTEIAADVPVDSFIESLKALNEEDRQKEVLYDLYGIFHIAGFESVWSFDKSVIQMYKENTVSVKTNITKCSLSIDNDNNVTSTFLGYISFVFNKEVNGVIEGKQVTFKEDDYIMLTYDFFNANVTLDNDDLTLTYTPKYGIGDLGIFKIKYAGGNEEMLLSTSFLTTDGLTPANSHRWVKK